MLADYAVRVEKSRGRRYPEPQHPYRGDFQRDRDRVIHSRAFRRLEAKTQVFTRRYSDHFRNRLTHTIEVAQIARTIAAQLGLNVDLVEALALVHDVGHPPFGHAGEKALDIAMREHGFFFDHNLHALRIVEDFELRYAAFRGLNLTFEVREGLRKHQAFYDPPRPGEGKYRCPSLEAQIANLADEITYYSHDLDDAVDFEILSAAQLEKNAVWQRSHRAVLTRYPDAREPELHKLIIRDIIDVQVQDVVTTSARSILDADVQSADEVRRQPAPLIRYSDELLEANRELRRFLYQNVYYHPRVAEVNERACEMLRKVFETYLVDPERLGEAAAKRIEKEGLHRTVCDYIAGMTDRYLMEEYARIAGHDAPPARPSN